MDTPAFHILIVSDDPAQCASIKKILVGQGMRNVEVAKTIEDAFECASAQAPDLVIVNLDIGNRASPELISALIAIDPEQKIVLVESEHSVYGPFLGLTRGARGYISKKDDDQSWEHAIETVLAGETYLSAESAREIALFAMAEAREPKNPSALLTPHQLSVFLRLASGESIEQAAKALGTHKTSTANLDTEIRRRLKIKKQGYAQRAREFWMIPPAPKAAPESAAPEKTKRAAS
ncbi:MAG: response regulator [Sulfuriferula sp.]